MCPTDAEFDGDYDKNQSPWQPGTPPLTLLRLLGIGQSLDNDQTRRRPPLPDARFLPGLAPLKNVDKNNRSSASSSSSFFGGFSRPGVAGRPLPKVSRRQKNRNDALRSPLRALSDDAVGGKPEIRMNFGGGPRLPHLHITPGGKLSRDHDVTAAVDDVTDTTKTGNTTDELGDSVMSTISKEPLSATSPISAGNNNDSVTAAPEVGPTVDESDDNETHGVDPFVAIHRNQPPIWPVPQHQHHMPLFPPGERQRFAPPSFGEFPGQRAIPDAPIRIFVPTGSNTAVQTVDLPPTGGQSSINWNGVDGPASRITQLPALNPFDHVAADVRTLPNKDLEPEEHFDYAPGRHRLGLNFEEEQQTTKTSTSHPPADEAGDAAVLRGNDADLPSNHPVAGDEWTTTSSSLSPATSTVSTTRGSSVFWGAASWRHSAGRALSATSFNILGIYTCVRVGLGSGPSLGWIGSGHCYIRQGRLVMLGVCLSVCLFVSRLATLRQKTTKRIFTKILLHVYLWVRKNWLNFGRHLEIFWMNLQLRDRKFFHSLAYISGEGDRIFMKISSQMYPWTRKSPLNFGGNRGPKFGSEYGLWIQTIFSLADYASLTAVVLLRFCGSDRVRSCHLCVIDISCMMLHYWSDIMWRIVN